MWRVLKLASLLMVVCAKSILAQTLACDQDVNSLGTCEGCEGQFFINYDCSEAFYCTKNVSEEGAEGCRIACDADEIVVANFGQQKWECVKKNETTVKCPGRFHVECNEIQHNITYQQCDCDAQLIVTGDCKEGFFCRSRLPNGGVSKTCENPDEIITIDLATNQWGCQANVKDRCPGLGGFKLGCYGDFPTPPPPIPNCEKYGPNPLGKCNCDDQLFIKDDCNQGFLCINGIDQGLHPGAHGCIIECPENQMIQFDFDAATYKCVESSEFKCPGNFNMACAADDVQINCSCPGEFWMKKGCKEGFYCETAMNGNANQGQIVQCPDRHVIEIKDLSNPLESWSCSNETRKCPDRENVGGFTFGCGKDSKAGKLNVSYSVLLAFTAFSWLISQ